MPISPTFNTIRKSLSFYTIILCQIFFLRLTRRETELVSGTSSVIPSGTSLLLISWYLTPLMEHSRNCISFSVNVPVLSVKTYSTYSTVRSKKNLYCVDFQKIKCTTPKLGEIKHRHFYCRFSLWKQTHDT